MSEIIVYIAGPVRGDTYWDVTENIRRAERLALEVWSLGVVALCPHTNTRNFHGALPDETWLRGDLVMLSRCDAIIFTEDWERSRGATAEHAFAEKHHIPIFYTTDALAAWLK
jgi:hypothetical protein